jgi:radical SAM superfamily enzyme YgiQ (UPF0313 family)
MIKEIKLYKSRFGIDHFFFWTENCTQDRDFLIDLMKKIVESGIDIRWSCNSRVDTIDLDLLRAMKKAGCLIVAYGVESGNQDILDRTGKNITLEQIKQAFTLTHQAGLQSIANCIFGLPGETKNTMRQTMRFLDEINPTYAQFYTAVPRPGSQLYTQAKKNNWLVTGQWDRFHQRDYVLNIDGLGEKEVVGFRNRANLLFYLNIKRIIKISYNLIKNHFR